MGWRLPLSLLRVGQLRQVEFQLRITLSYTGVLLECHGKTAFPSGSGGGL